ncbi:MAG: tetratricopeptide repeat protein [Planctomycetes bacterium]|nr:tetratricopeptide repeat protein [Planctomycetota bacterium]
MLVKFCSRIIEACWLVALAGIPVFFNPYTTRVFESDKTYLLRSITIVMLLAWFVKKSAEGFSLDAAFKEKGNRIILGSVLALGTIYFISSIFSITPYFSFKGYFLREEGFYSLACYIVTFFIVLGNLREPGQLSRLLHTMILSATIVSVYGILQYFKIDTVAWAGGERTRVTTTLGGPIFAGAYLIIVIPLILSRLMEYITDGFRRNIPIIILYALVLAVNIYCMLLTKSRGPFVGFIISLFLFFMLFVRLRQMKRLFLSVVTITAVFITFMVILNIPNGPLSGLQKRFGRTAQLYEMEGSGKVRLLIWEGAIDILRSSPERLAFGHGLESPFPLYHKYTPSSFGRYEGSAIPDHSHNDTFDILITSGIMGLLTYLGIISLLIYYTFNRLGFFTSLYSRKLFILSLAGGVALGLIIPIIMGKMIFIGIAIPFGFMAGLFSYLLLTWKTQPVSGGNNLLLLIGLISAVIGNFAELQFGLGVTATRLYFWVYAAIILFIINSLPQAKPASTDIGASDKKDTINLALVYGLLTGLIIAFFSFALLKRKFIPEGLPANFYIIIVTIGFISTLYLVFAAIRSARVIDTIIYLFTAIIWGAIFHFIFSALLSDLTLFPTAFINYAYAFVGATIFVVAIFIRQDAASFQANKASFSTVLAAVILIPLSFIAVHYTNLREDYADAWCREGENHEKGQRWAEAIASFQKSIELSPQTDYYYANLSRAYKSSGDYNKSIETLRGALKANPLNRFHNIEIARTYRLWSDQIKDNPADQESKLTRSLQTYSELAMLSPKNPTVPKEMANIYFTKQDYNKAIEYYLKAVALDSQLAEAYVLIGKSYKQLNDAGKTIENYEKAFSVAPGNAMIRSEFIRLGEEYFNQNKFEDSLQVNLTLIKLAPKDYQHYHNTSVVLDQLGRIDQAIENSKKALELVRLYMPTQTKGVEGFLQKLEQKNKK